MRSLLVMLLALAVLAGAATCALAQRGEPLPTELEGVGITEHLDARVPLDTTFDDETGKQVTLGSYFVKDRPVILTLNYFTCPMLCTLILNGMTDAMKEIPWTPGRQFEIVTVSFDPTETPTLARLKKKSYLEAYGRPDAAAGWHFLTGEEESIRALTDAVGFKYRWDDTEKQFAHAAAIFILTPDGHISRYLYGVQFEPKDLRLALLEASSGKIGSPMDQVLMYCYHYDASSGRYSIAAQQIMKIGGILTVLVLAGWLIGFWLRERSQGRRLAPRPQT
jgi:protein SCO1/2